MLDVRLQQEGPIPLDVSLACAPGELLALVGPSGAGKSTVLRAIAGLHRARHGIITVAGQPWQNTERALWTATRDRRVGMVSQSYALFPHLTVLENVAEPLYLLPRSERHARALHALQRLHLQGLENRRPQQLSGGQQQRVALARALVREPQVLLLDEPFAAVDQMTRERLYEELAELRHGLQVPVVLVTHSMVEAELLADRMAVLHAGKTLQTGRPAEVLRRPASEEVARLVGFGNVFDTPATPPDAGLAFTWTTLGNARLAVPLEHSGRGAASRLRWGIASHRVRVLGAGQWPDEPQQCVDAVVERAVTLGENVRLSLRLADGVLLRAVVARDAAVCSAAIEGAAVRAELPLKYIVRFGAHPEAGDG